MSERLFAVLDRVLEVPSRPLRRAISILLLLWLSVVTPISATVLGESIVWVNLQSALAIDLALFVWLSSERPSEVES